MNDPEEHERRDDQDWRKKYEVGENPSTDRDKPPQPSDDDD